MKDNYNKIRLFLKTFIFVVIGFLGVFALGANGAQAEFYESTFTSQVFNNFHSSVDYGVMNWSVNIPANTSLVFSTRAGNISIPDGTWTGWSVISNSGDSLNTFDNNRYIQYKVVLGTDDLSVTPTVYDVSMTKNVTQLVSSVFDSQDSQNIINGISWNETLAGSSNAVFQMRSSVDNSTWTSWQGPSGTESWFSDPNGGETSGAGFRDQVSDRYYQYRAILISNTVGGTDWPTVDNVDVDYELPDTATRFYESSFVSSIKDAGTAQEYLNIVWNDNVLPNTSLSIKIRTDSNADMSGATAWASCDLVSNNTDISSNNCVTDGDQYFEYQVTLGTDDLSKTPALYDITVYALQPGGVISSPYDSTDAANAISGVTWTENETLPSGSQTKIYLRTGADTTALASASWTEIASSTPSSLTAGCAKLGQIVTCDNTTATVIPLSMQDGIGDRYFQYKMELIFSGATSPTVEQIEIIYFDNATPVASATTLNSGGAITLTENTTTSISVTGIVTDDDSYQDLTSVKVAVYKVGTICAVAGDADNDDCYFWTDSAPDVDVSCTGASDTTYAVSHDFDIQYYADGGTWEATVTPADGGAGTPDTSAGVTLNDLQSLDVSSTISYGSVAAGSNSTGDHTATVTNTGNVAIDTKISGTVMSCTIGEIPIANQEYALTTFSYGVGTDLSVTATDWNLELAAPADDTAPITDTTYWQVGVPNGTAGTCSGTNTIITRALII